MIDTQRFWSHCMELDDSPNTCWVWVGACRDSDGIGRYFVSRRREIRANHAAYELRFGEPVPCGRTLRKDCANPQCVRHWVLGGPARKLSPEDVREIQRKPRTTSFALIAKRFHISRFRAWVIWARACRT